MSSPAPTNDELLAAVRALWTVSNPPGVKRLVSSLKTSHPEWEPHINSKTVRAAIRKCEEETGVSNKVAEKVREAPGAEPTAEKTDDDELDIIAHLRAHVETWSTWMAGNPWPRVVPRGREEPCMSPDLLQPHIIPFILLPAAAAAPLDPAASHQENLIHLAFQIFYVEWDCFMGPDPAEPIPPATPLVPNYEAMAFVTLFPYGMGHYLGEQKQNGLTFDQYVLNRLRLADERFRNSAE
ncbi:hypothetical protein B0H17DRAFT_1087746 [Mycena rosella]|uniref:Uncharacterized protein n=1 Tax=Mycena rosella TaxID=1033263 RepID=A0AAD7CXI2_MYCRO|nr:hypothetical protein B0H17DRAFT_1087746 [Mycena rosella]